MQGLDQQSTLGERALTGPPALKLVTAAKDEVMTTRRIPASCRIQLVSAEKTRIPLAFDARGTHLGRLKDRQSSLDGGVDKVFDRVRIGQCVCSECSRSAE